MFEHACQTTSGQATRAIATLATASSPTRRPSWRHSFVAAGPNNFNAIRLALASAVIVSHAYPLSEGHERHEPLVRLVDQVLFRHPTTLGALAVDAFFIISGFLIAMSWERRRSTVDFFGRRVRRIYPGFIVAAAVSAYLVPYLAINGTDWTHVGLNDFVVKTARLLGIEHPSAFVDNAYPGVTNGSLWSISYEFWCYIGVACLAGIGGLARRGVVTAIFCVSALAAFAMSASDIRPGGGPLGTVLGSPMLWARLLPFYMAGIVVFRWRDRIRFSTPGAAAMLAVAAATSFVPHAWAATLPVTLTYLIFWLAYHPGLPRWNVTRFGDWSYGVYLYGFPIQQLCVRYAGGTLSPAALMAVSLPLTLVAGAASWMLVERWFVRSAKRSLQSLQTGSSIEPSTAPGMSNATDERIKDHELLGHRLLPHQDGNAVASPSLKSFRRRGLRHLRRQAT